MTTFSLEKLLDKVDNKYKLVVVASKRAREILERADLNIQSSFKKATTIALEEVLSRKVKYEEPRRKAKQ